MSKKNFSSHALEKAKRELGKAVHNLRGELSLRSLSDAVGLSPSNLTYIEKGVNAPTAEVYEKLIAVLNPPQKMRQKMDQQYMCIRQAPPPDICRIILDNNLTPIIRHIENQQLTDSQKDELAQLLESFKTDNERGENDNV